MGAVSTASKRAEEFFAEVAAEYGVQEGDIVRIPMRQCELARRKQIAASTVGAHLRAMGGRVVQRYPVIVLAHTELAAPHSSATRLESRPIAS